MRASGRDRPFPAGRAVPRGRGDRPGRSPGERFSYKSLVVHRPHGHGLLYRDRSTRRYRGSVPRWNGGPRLRIGRRKRGHRQSVPRWNGGVAERRPGCGGRVPWVLRKAGPGLSPSHGRVRRPRVSSAVRVSSRTCGDVWFRQGPDTGEREPRLPSGLVKKVAKRSTWQPPVDSRPRCLGSKVSVEATSASWVVEASLSEAAIRTSVT